MISQIGYDEMTLSILDQRKLPLKIEYIKAEKLQQVCDAIKTLAVRGAPLIGVTAALGLRLVSDRYSGNELGELKAILLAAEKELRATRPTAVNLMWGLDRMLAVIALEYSSIEKLKAAVAKEAMTIWHEDVELCERMGRYGAELIPDKSHIITHCNTGALATAGIGTALGVILTAHDAGKQLHVYVDETRPLLQGGRLTAWELACAKVPFTLITDNMAAHVMKTRHVDLAITGADRIAANGDSANKIGTYSLAVVAKAHNVPFYIAAPYSTIDMNIKSGDQIVIEQRAAAEVRGFGDLIWAPECEVYNPAFDVTPAELISGIITDRGIVYPPFEQNLKRLFENE